MHCGQTFHQATTLIALVSRAHMALSSMLLLENSCTRARRIGSVCCGSLAMRGPLEAGRKRGGTKGYRQRTHTARSMGMYMRCTLYSLSSLCGSGGGDGGGEMVEKLRSMLAASRSAHAFGERDSNSVLGRSIFATEGTTTSYTVHSENNKSKRVFSKSPT